MSVKLIQVHHLLEHALGTKVAGLEGRAYYVGEEGQLHRILKGDMVAEKPGCLLEDAAEFSHFHKAFKVDMGALAPAPPPPPAAGDAPGGAPPNLEPAGAPPDASGKAGKPKKPRGKQPKPKAAEGGES